MKSTPWILVSLLFLFGACRDSKETMLIGTWHAQDLRNPAMEEMMAQQLQFLDTFGRHTSPEENLEIYGSRNVDSIRESLTETIEELRAMQDSAVKNTWFQFRTDGVVLMNFGSQRDSVHWYINKDDQLVLDEMGLKGTGSEIVMDIVHISKEAMTLRYTENGLTSTVEFLAIESESAGE